jgi:membrane protein
MLSTRPDGEPPPSLRHLRTWRDLVAGYYDGVNKHRTTGLAAEVAFFALFSIPPAFLAFFGALGFIGDALGKDFTDGVRREVIQNSQTFLTKQAVGEVVIPLLDKTLGSGHIDVVSIGLVGALFSASRSADAFIEALNVVYDIDERLALWRRRALAIIFTLVGTLTSAIVFPLLVVGPEIARSIAAPLHIEGTFMAVWSVVYWPLVGLLSLLALTTTYHFATPFRAPYRRDLPGAAFALALWIAGSAALRGYASWSVESSPIYGSLAAPMVLLLWLYYTAFAVLMGAELNSVIEATWPAISRKEKRRVLRKAVDEMRADGADVEPVSTTGRAIEVDTAKAEETLRQ